MARKTPSEVCRAYRERKKATLGEEWLQRERMRVKKYYVPVTDLTPTQLKKRRKEGREAMALLRYKKSKEAEEHAQEPASDQRITRARCQQTPPLKVKLDFGHHSTSSDNGKRTRTRVSRAVSRANRTIDSLKTERDKLRRKTWRLQKKLQRMKQMSIRKKLIASMTPADKAERDLRKVGLDPSKYTSIKKKLVAHHAMLAEMKQKVKSGNVNKKRDVQRCMTGRIVKKYRILRLLGRETSINRNKLNERFSDVTKRRQPQARLRIKEEVHHFYERDDISRQMPGKKDAVRLEGRVKRQARVLTDYLRNLWMKFCSEHPSIHLSLSLFCRLRPGHVRLTSFTSRQTCLCIHHQNVALMLKALQMSNSPDACIKEHTDEEFLQRVDELGTVDEVHFHTWKSVESEGKSRTKCIPIVISKSQFKQRLAQSLLKFRDHVDRIAQQYQAISTLKAKLTSPELIIQMDFSENFICKALQEVQSAYWSQIQVSLHPVVIYYKEEDEDILRHKSYVFVSGDTSHNSSAVITIMKKLNVIIKDTFPVGRMLHYITDSPVSQYRNRSIFHVIGNYRRLYDLDASWTYHETGHGKGPCDGVGGVLKRQASEAIKQEKAVIQDAQDFYAWATSIEQSSKMTFVMYTEEDVQVTTAELEAMETKQIKGTMDLHAVLPTSQPGQLAFRKTSCFNDCCYQFGQPALMSCPGWFVASVGLESTPDVLHHSDVSDGCWVAASYQDHWYLGQILEVDQNDHLYLVNFLEKSSKSSSTNFRWPRRPDLLWRSLDELITLIPPPTPVSTSKNMVEVSEDTIKKIKEKYSCKG